MTHSSSDLKYNERDSIINKLHKLNISEDDIENVTYHDRFRLLNSIPVLLVRHFQDQVEVGMDHWGKPSIMLFMLNFKFVAHHMYNVFCGWPMLQF